MKIGNIYDLKSFQSFKDSGASFKDASGAGTILARSLEYIDPTLFQKKYPELAFMNSGIAVDNSGGYASKIRSLRTRPIGEFRNAGDNADNKGNISIAGETSYIGVIAREAQSKWTDTQIKEAELENRNLPQEFLQYHNDIYMREIDEAGLIGMQGNKGLLNHEAFATSASAKTADKLKGIELYTAIATLITDQRNAVNNTPEYSATHVMMPTSVLNIASKTILSSTGGFGANSVLRALENNFDVKFLSSFRASDVDGTGKTSTVAFSASEQAMKMRVPEPLRIGEIVKLGSFDFQVDSKYRVAGLDVLEATAGRILTGL